jgi:WD40 repeat protein
VCTATFAGHVNGVANVAFSPDGTLLATGSWDKTTRLWRVADGVCTATFAGHSKDVLSVLFSPDGTLLATISDDKTIKLWRVADGVCTATLGDGVNVILCIAFSPGGTVVVYVDGCLACHVWWLSDLSLIGSQTLDANVLRSLPCELKVIKCEDDEITLELRSGELVQGFCVELCFTTSGTTDNTFVAPLGAGKKPQQRTQGTESTVSTSARNSRDGEHSSTSTTNSRDGEYGLDVSKELEERRARLASFSRLCISELVIGAPIASGSSCSVHRAQWRGREYALKLYHMHVLSEIDRELAVVQFLQHPSILRVYAIVQSTAEGPVTGLLMELATEPLGAALRSPARPTAAVVLKWLHELAEAVEFAHGCGVVHSDIKPDNVMMFDAPGQMAVAKLTDFGSSYVLSTVGASVTTARGTPMFIAPEYAAQETGPTKASDVYSFGMTMWCALAAPGTDHGLGKIALQIALALNSGRRPPLGAVDACHRPLIERCWAAEASARPSMIEVEVELRAMMAPLPAPGGGLPSLQLWASYLRHTGLESACRALQYHRHDSLYLSEPVVDAAHPCHKFVCRLAGAPPSIVQRVVMVGVDDAAASAFVTLHEAEMNSRALNAALRKEEPTDAASVAGIRRLQQSFVPAAAQDGSEPLARMLLAWHGTPYSRVVDVCRDGPRSLRTEDPGFFGAGSYFALEAEYANHYSKPDETSGERAVILFVVSVSEVKCVTPDADYRRIEDARTPQLHGFSRFYSGNRDTAVALAPGYDAHFIPVRYYGRTHPLTGAATTEDVDYQAVDEASGAAEFHELVIGSHHRCMPLAVVYLKP